MLTLLPHDQAALLERWLPGAVVVRDHGWGLVERHVLELEHDGARYVLKVGGPSDGHMAREIRAHDEWLEPWTSRGLAPERVASDGPLRMLLTRWLPGELVLDSPVAADPGAYRQAGALLALLHAQPGADDVDHERRETAKALAWLDRDHRIDAVTEARLREVVGSWDTAASTPVVPTHGDWQPRNWLSDHGTVRVIDLGRADLRPAASDLLRLSAREFQDSPDLEAAFLDGYGADPRVTCPVWQRLRLREAISTAVWAHQVGDEGFEAHGHRMIADALADC